jgi:glucose-6-phosphate isomerase
MSWIGAGHVVGQAFWFGSLLMLAVLLPPKAFGTVALGLLLVTAATRLMEAGTRGSIIVAARLTRQQLLSSLILNSVVGAALSVALANAGKNITVLMPYADRLAWFAKWYVQLWAESLGKDGKGTTPIRAMGTVDQHSQLQLYLAGPRDKMFTLVTTEVAGTGGAVSAAFADRPELGYLAGRTMGDLLDAEQRATAASLVSQKRPTRRLHLARLDEASLGALLMHFMLETIIAADLFGVDAFDQPAVEEGKVLARQYLGEMKR